MGDANEANRILNAATQAQLLEERDAEIAKIMKLRLILQQLRKMNVKSLDVPDVQKVELGFKALSVADYLQLKSNSDQEADCLLNLQQCRKVELSYTERKAVQKQLFIDLKKELQPVAAFAHELRSAMPEIFNAPASNGTEANVAPPPALQSIVDLEKQRRANVEKLVILRNRKCGLLKVAAELKMGSRLDNELDFLYKQARVSQTKAGLLHCYFVNDLVSSTEHAYKAVKEVEGYLNEALEELTESGQQ